LVQPPPENYQAYLEELGQKLNALEILTDKATGIDDRLDILAHLQIEQLRLLKSSILAQPNLITGIPPYNTRRFSLDTARPEPGDEVSIPGNSIIAYTNGTLEDIYIRLDNPTRDAVHLYEFNPYYHSLGFGQFYLETTTQPGKYLRLLVLRGLPGNVVGNLAVNIVAQDLAQIAVDIATQTLSNLSVNITAQDLAELVIKIAAQTVGIYLQPEWAATEGIDKNFYGEAANIASKSAGGGAYTVPAGKTLYLVGMTFFLYGAAAADRDLLQIGVGALINGTDNIWLATVGGNGGGNITFPKPIVLVGGKLLYYYCYNFSNHLANLGISTWGYEV